MSLKFKFRSGWALTIVAMAGFVSSSYGRATLNPDAQGNPKRKASLMKTAAGCNEGQAAVDLDINNIRARIMTGGDMWWDRGSSEARYEIPKGSRKNALYAGALWVGGRDTQDQLKVTAQTYRQTGNDYWPGPLNAANAIDQATCSAWDHFWKVDKSDILRFRELIKSGETAVEDADFDVIKEWPASGNVDARGANSSSLFSSMVPNRKYAPFVDVDSNGEYNWRAGDYPDINGDQYIFRIYNDMGNTKTQTGTAGIGLEVQASSFAYATKDYLNDASFYNYRLINRGNLTLDSCYTSTWTDADLGYAFDDYIGCDTGRGLGILYNALSKDGTGQSNSYGDNPPMVGVDFFIGPARITFDADSNKWDTLRLKMTNFTYFTNQDGKQPDEITDPQTGIQFYRYMTGSNKNGNPFTNDFQGQRGQNTKGYQNGPVSNTVFFGDPDVAGTWSECYSGNPAGDRRFIHSAGPFKLTGGGVTNDITIGVVWVPEAGGCPNTSFGKIRLADDAIQELFENNFKTIEGPEAPRLVIREMNRKLIFYILNDSLGNNGYVDSSSTNYKEQFGYSQKSKYRVYSSKALKLGYTEDQSVYKFEGYRVFQLKNKEVQPAQIFGENGEVNNDVAVEVFQCDLKNGITTVWNHERDARNTQKIKAIQKVAGKDQGITHSFELSTDQFATGADKNLVNFRTYYYVAIAYAVNDFRPFSFAHADSSQDRSYLESAHGRGGIPIPIYAVMPNNSNGDRGTEINSFYGKGVIVKRMEGTGNGGRAIQMDNESEELALQGPDYQAKNPVYLPGGGPVNVKVIDPVKVKGMDWELFIQGPTYTDASRGIVPATGSWKLIGTNGTETDTIFSETNLGTMNEQILERYGLSVTLNQTVRPGDDQPNGNGYISSDVSYANNSLTWLAGVKDEEDESFQNWIRSGTHKDPTTNPPACDWSDYYNPGSQLSSPSGPDTVQVYEKLLNNNTLTESTWAPYVLATTESRSNCGFGVAAAGTAGSSSTLFKLQSVDIVFTNDKSKWSRCVVVEAQDDITLAEGNARKLELRKHQGWNTDVASNGAPIYSGTAADEGMSWFPGYAINQETGERLNIFFSEDSWQKGNNGNDMIWNPTSTLYTPFGEPAFGGKHYVYVSETKYDACATIRTQLTGAQIVRKDPFYACMWVGTPMLRPGGKLLSLQAGIIPTETRLRFRVTRPYARYVNNAVTPTPRNNYLPLYSFSTKGYAPVALGDEGNSRNNDKQSLLDSIHVVPNPYYAYNGYEGSRLDTRVRIINLPRRATVSIYSLDGSLIRQLTKDNANQGYIDWDVRNAKGLPVASGMYLFHVKADNIGEFDLRWFGAMRPIDITTY